MNKLFHVFVSSTYSDLQEERSRVTEGLSKAGQVPEGMEIFPASSQKQIDFIKSVIDRCDRSWLRSEITLTWQEILKIVGPEFRAPRNTAGVKATLEQYLKDVAGRSFYAVEFQETHQETVLNQLELLGYMRSAVYNLKNGGQGVFYKLTPLGVSESLRLNAVTSNTSTGIAKAG